MLNYLSKDLFNLFVNACIKTEISNMNNFMNLVYLFTEFFNTLGLSLSEKLRFLEKKSPNSNISAKSTNQNIIPLCLSISDMKIIKDITH